MWVLAIAINGLLFVSAEPFNSEEACFLAQKTAQLGRCIELETPEATQEAPSE